MIEAQRIIRSIKDNIERVIIGKGPAVEKLLVALICNSHVLLDDVPGVGKTTLAQALAFSIAGDFKRIQFTPDVMPTDVTGFNMYNPRTSSFDFVQGAIMANIVLADEINRTPPKTQSSLMEVMEEKQVTVDGKTHHLPTPFMVVATQNPVEYLGTYPLPEAQIDRFLLRLSLGYPSPEDEYKILKARTKGIPLKSILPVVTKEEVLRVQDKVDEVHVDDALLDYIVALVQATRHHGSIHLGVSPRGALHLSKASKALALLRGRYYVLPDDIQEMAASVFAHRLVLNQDALMKKRDKEDYIKEILGSIPVPVVRKHAT